MTSRRRVLAGLAGLAAGSLTRPGWAEVGNPAFLAAAQMPDKSFALQGLASGGETVFSVALPARGHAAAAHPTRAEAVAFARRPGGYALVIDCGRGGVLARLTPPEGRQFNGHGCFSADGAVLYTSEQLTDGSAGRLGLWDTATWQRMAEVPTGGIGPHDLRRLADGGLVVANGGIATDPADRTKLNLDTMRPSLVWLSAEGGIEAVAELAPDHAQASIRHLALMPDGRVAFAMQWEGDPAEVVPLLGLCGKGETAVLCPAPEAEAPRMRGYAGSIACDAAGRLAMTSPKGGVVQIFGADGSFQVTLRRADASGVAANGAEFLVTDGGGGISRIAQGRLSPLGTTPLAWDNHLVELGHLAGSG